MSLLRRLFGEKPKDSNEPDAAPIDASKLVTSDISIHQAGQEGAIGMIDKFIAQGSDLNQRDASGLTALDYALKSSHWDAARKLRKAGAKESGKRSETLSSGGTSTDLPAALEVPRDSMGFVDVGALHSLMRFNDINRRIDGMTSSKPASSEQKRVHEDESERVGDRSSDAGGPRNRRLTDRPETNRHSEMKTVQRYRDRMIPEGHETLFEHMAIERYKKFEKWQESGIPDRRRPERSGVFVHGKEITFEEKKEHLIMSFVRTHPAPIAEVQSQFSDDELEEEYERRRKNSTNAVEATLKRFPELFYHSGDEAKDAGFVAAVSDALGTENKN